MGIASITHGEPPPWPTENNWLDIVNTHNELVVAGELLSSASWSITLIMVCAAIGKAIPIKYRLKTRPMGIGDHSAYLKDYAVAVSSGGHHTEKGKIIVKPVKRFAEDLGVPVQVINEGLAKIFKLKITNRTPLPSEGSPHTPAPDYLPNIEAFEIAYRMVSRPGHSVSIDAVLDQIEVNANKDGLVLKNNWRVTTEKNIKIWSDKSNGAKR